MVTYTMVAYSDASASLGFALSHEALQYERDYLRPVDQCPIRWTLIAGFFRLNLQILLF